MWNGNPKIFVENQKKKNKSQFHAIFNVKSRLLGLTMPSQIQTDLLTSVIPF